MYLTIEETAAYLDLSIEDILRLIRTQQVKFHDIDGVILLNQNQFDFYLAQREKAIQEYQLYLQTPIPEDSDIKDED